MGPIQITFVQCLAFASLIVAVDPVAVLAIFQEVGVNQVLYFLVFGESLFNDAVTVVLYNTMKTFTKMETIPPEQIALGFAAFFTVSLGGLFIGMFFGFLTALLTRFTGHVRVVEPLAVFVLAYMALLTTEMFHFSGIVSVIGCGLVQAHYAFHNISHKSYTTVKYFIKMMAATNDCLIFLFMGMALVHPDHVWHPGFICWTLLLCLVVRFLVTFGLTFIVNKVKKTIKISYEEQFIMSYGGLRGAVAYCLVAMFDKKYVPQNMFESTTLVVVLFTVFVQGATIKPLVKLFKIRTAATKSLSMCNEIQDRANDHIVAGIEQVLGHYGTNFFREFFDNVDHKYLKKFFQKNPESRDAEIMAIYEKISLKQHLQEVKHITTPTDENENKDKELDEAFENMTKVSGAVALPGKPTVSEKHPDVVLRKSRRGDRASRLKIFSQGQRDFSMIAEPSPQDFRMMALPSSPYAFRKFDRNLTKDSDDKDALVHKLRDKFERQSRWHKVSHGQTVDGAVRSHGPRHMTLDPKLLRAQTTDDVETPHHGKPTTLPHAFTIDMPSGSTAPLSAPPAERDFKFEPIDEVVEPEESDPLVAKQQISRGSKKHGKLERGETIDMPDVMEMKAMRSKQGVAPKSQGSSQAQPGVQKPQQGDPEVQITESSALLQNDKASSDA
ncbi:unnamed protein product [Owenia fusiformis]|nr:unnamed protein product [Owenia fusiformis]